MQKISSFTIDHNKLKEGLYLSRIDGTNSDIVTYDLRMVPPNAPPFLENAAVHTFEHLFATYVRNSELKENIIYFGPMGCLTGFYFIVQNVSQKDVLELIKQALGFISSFQGEIPGSGKAECGNYKMHDLTKAKNYAVNFLEILSDWTVEKMKYF